MKWILAFPLKNLGRVRWFWRKGTVFEAEGEVETTAQKERRIPTKAALKYSVFLVFFFFYQFVFSPENELHAANLIRLKSQIW